MCGCFPETRPIQWWFWKLAYTCSLLLYLMLSVSCWLNSLGATLKVKKCSIMLSILVFVQEFYLLYKMLREHSPPPFCRFRVQILPRLGVRPRAPSPFLSTPSFTASFPHTVPNAINNNIYFGVLDHESDWIFQTVSYIVSVYDFSWSGESNFFVTIRSVIPKIFIMIRQPVGFGINMWSVTVSTITTRPYCKLLWVIFPIRRVYPNYLTNSDGLITVYNCLCVNINNHSLSTKWKVDTTQKKI